MAEVGGRGETVKTEPAPYPRPLRTAIVVAICGAFVATVAIVTVGAVLGTLLGPDAPPGAGDM